MLHSTTNQLITAYALNCSINEAAHHKKDPRQIIEIQRFQKALEICLKAVLPSLTNRQDTILEEHDFKIFELVSSNTAITLLNNELQERGIMLHSDSFKQSFALAAKDSSGFILKVRQDNGK